MNKFFKKKKSKVLETIDNNNLGSLAKNISYKSCSNLFYSLPVIINFTNDKILITKEFKNNSKKF